MSRHGRSAVKAATHLATAAAAGLTLILALGGGSATATATSAAGAPGRWTPVAVGNAGQPDGLVSAERDSGDRSLHVAWTRRTGGNSYDLMHTAITAGGTVQPPQAIVSGWAALGDPDLFFIAHGIFLVFFPGQRTTGVDEPYSGLNLAHGSEGGVPGVSWSLYGDRSIWTDEYSYARTPSVVWNVSGTYGVTWNGRSDMVIRRCADGTASNPCGTWPAYHYGPSACCNLGQNIATDQDKAVWIAWCSQNDAPAGRWVQAIDYRTYVPVGSPVKLPGSGAPLCESGGREPLVFRPGGGFYVADAAGARGTKVLLWRIGSSPRSLEVTSSGDSHQRVALAAAPDGRLWVAWRTFHGANVIHLRRSNEAATRFGAEVRVKGPAGAVEVQHIDLDAQAGRVGVLGTFSFVNSSRNTFFHTQAFPGLTLAAHGREVVQFLVTDAGDPVEGATIKVGGRTLHSNRRGVASIDLAPKRFRARASKAGYTGATLFVKSS